MKLQPCVCMGYTGLWGCTELWPFVILIIMGEWHKLERKSGARTCRKWKSMQRLPPECCMEANTWGLRVCAQLCTRSINPIYDNRCRGVPFLSIWPWFAKDSERAFGWLLPPIHLLRGLLGDQQYILTACMDPAGHKAVSRLQMQVGYRWQSSL